MPQAIRRRFGVEKPSFRTPKLCFQPTITPFPRRITGEATRRSRPVTVIGSCVQLSARTPPQVVDMGAQTSPI
ncbi:hypothetical protein Taro_051985 [Colocasia esculenta]|uniref:Uncharacterized protein n=1 Tax=Colocasia esculenta TaxID=4460 RepID=A0A843XHE0_COLES|nr:hypothetical protein [Colocasia esculenta]